jgi:hypothetical protein
MQARSDDVTEFLRRTESLVPSGAEANLIDIDAAIAQLLA